MYHVLICRDVRALPLGEKNASKQCWRKYGGSGSSSWTRLEVLFCEGGRVRCVRRIGQSALTDRLCNEYPMWWLCTITCTVVCLQSTRLLVNQRGKLVCRWVPSLNRLTLQLTSRFSSTKTDERCVRAFPLVSIRRWRGYMHFTYFTIFTPSPTFGRLSHHMEWFS